MTKREEFNEIYNKYIKRPGAEELFEYLNSDKSDFFTAPASARFHGSYEGGLLEHSLNVYHCLTDYLSRERVQKVYGLECSDESAAVVALLHDVCKINFYRVDYRNAKNDAGVWEKVPYFAVDDKLPYGHGEKSVYIVSGFMKLTRPEAFAIRYHMGFSGIEDKNAIGASFEQYPLAFALATADMEATYYLEGKPKK
jgi:hypothetical protein